MMVVFEAAVREKQKFNTHRNLTRAAFRFVWKPIINWSICKLSMMSGQKLDFPSLGALLISICAGSSGQAKAETEAAAAAWRRATNN